MIATLDTNVLVSGTLFGGVPGTIIDASIDRRFTLALSPAILDEYEKVLSRSTFGLAEAAVEILVRDMESHAFVVYPLRRHYILHDDPDDNAIIDCAVEAAADVIVSGDRHLTELEKIEGTPVIMPREFAGMIE